QQGQDMVKRGFLGLFIVVTSYLVLSTINPQLLTLKLEITALSPPFASVYNTPSVPTVTMGVIDATANSKNIVLAMQKKVPVNARGVIVPDTSPDKKETVAMIETPFIRISQLLGEAQIHTQKIAELLKHCKCGQSFNYIAVEGAFSAECKEGAEPKNVKSIQEGALAAGLSKDQALCLTQADDCGTNPLGEKINDPASPVNGALKCDLREVTVVNSGATKKDIAGEEILDEGGKPILEDPLYQVKVCTKYIGGGSAEELYLAPPEEIFCSQKPMRDLPPLEQDGLIKYHRERLVYLQSLLSPEGMKLSVEQMINLENKLKISASGFILASNNEGFFEQDFQNWKAQQESMVPGIKFVIDLPAQFAVSQEYYHSPLALNNGFIKADNNFFVLLKNGAKKLALRFFTPQTAMAQALADSLGLSQSPLSSGAIYYIKNVENYNDLYGAVQGQLKNNQDMDLEARRANLFSVLAEMSLEQIDKIFKDCLTSAFGNADYNFSGNVQEIIQQAIKQGTADYAVLVLSRASANFAGLVGEEIIKAINDEADGHLKEKCAVAECDCGVALENLAINKKCSGGVAFSDWLKVKVDGDKTNGDCVSACVRENIPPHFLSNQLAIIITEPLYKRLPESLQEIFTTKVREVVFSDKFNKKLDSEMIDVYGKAFKSALTTSTESLIPGLKKVLDTKVDDYIKQYAATTSGILHKFLSVKIADLRPFINKKTEEIGKIIAEKVGNGIKNEMAGFKASHPEIFTENKMCNDCIVDSMEGYTYDLGGTCRKAAPEEINEGWWQYPDPTCNLIKPLDPDSDYEIMGTLRTDPALLSQVCKNAGYCWSADFEIDNYWEGANKDPEKCVECSTLQFGRMFSSLTTKAGWKEIGKAGLRGAIDFTEQFAIALTQTVMHTAMAYIQVELEDRVFTKAEPYLKQAIDLQTNLAKFLGSTVEQLLPTQMAGILNGNIDQLLA
ncbi:MAG: hypothetical protein AAB842_00965, partial [Patescibacteria group bacterium]